jgi:arsenate reductase-like glutaredoxin family protein
MSNKNYISLATDERQLLLFYNAQVKNHKEIYAYAVSANKDLLAIDVATTKVAATVWTEIAAMLGGEPKDLLKTDHANFVTKHGKGHEVDNDDALDFLQKDADMLVFPIIIEGTRAKEVKLYGQVQQFFDPDTSEIKIP